jgi:predicted NBD/HSP70 family sugar kinase
MVHIRKSKHNKILSVNAKVGRNINRSIILNSIRERQPISRAEISTMTGLNKSTVSNIVESLVNENLVEEDIAPNQNIGRNPINLQVKRGRHFVGAIYFASSKAEIAIVDIDGSILTRTEIPLKMDQPAAMISHCIEELNLLQAKTNVPLLKGIGITVAGIVDSTQSKVVYAANLGWKEIDLVEIIHGIDPNIPPVTIENDAKASALAELLLGRHETIPMSLVFLSVGYGIGAGIVHDNHIVSGHTHAAGEFGHMTIMENGDLCSCGKHGCWEMYASDRATIQRYVQEKKLPAQASQTLTIMDVIDGALKGEEAACAVLLQTAQYLGVGIANIICTIDPEVVIIGGPVTHVWDLLYPTLHAVVEKRSFLGALRTSVILPTSLRGNPPLLGAAALPIQKIFADFRIAR